MRHARPLAPLTLLAVTLLAGCTSQERERRAADWAEVLTLTVGEGVGAKARLGPAQLGLYRGADKAGLRAGSLGSSSWDSHDNYDYVWAFYGREFFEGWQNTRPPLSPKKTTAATQRFPFIVSPYAPYPNRWHDIQGDERLASGAQNAAYRTQCEIALGLGFTVRLGANPGEFVDAVLGHFGADIYGDDLRRPTSRPKPDPKLRNPILNDPKTLPITPVKP